MDLKRYEYICSRVVGLHWRERLFVSHCLEGVTYQDDLSAVDEESSQLRLCRGGHSCFDDLGDGDDGSIVRGNG